VVRLKPVAHTPLSLQLGPFAAGARVLKGINLHLAWTFLPARQKDLQVMRIGANPPALQRFDCIWTLMHIFEKRCCIHEGLCQGSHVIQYFKLQAKSLLYCYRGLVAMIGRWALTDESRWGSDDS
jgi:hypothetical protein